MPALRLFSTLGVAGVLDVLTPRFTAATLDIVLAPTQLLARRIRDGEVGDVAILIDEAVDEFVAAGILRPGRIDLARSLVGIAVKAGAPKPDISSTDAFVATLLAAQSVALSLAGASGLFFAGLLERLGIAAAIQAKATVIPSGFTGELVARGEAEIAVQQISELMVVPGIDIVGPLPKEIEGVSIFSAGIFAGTQMTVQAEALLALLSAPETRPIYAAKGLEPLA